MLTAREVVLTDSSMVVVMSCLGGCVSCWWWCSRHRNDVACVDEVAMAKITAIFLSVCLSSTCLPARLPACLSVSACFTCLSPSVCLLISRFRLLLSLKKNKIFSWEFDLCCSRRMLNVIKFTREAVFICVVCHCHGNGAAVLIRCANIG